MKSKLEGQFVKNVGIDLVSCLKLTSGYLQENERNSTSLYLRDNQIELWDEVYAYLSEPGSNAIVTGNSGIGKSRSMTYLLKLLLKNKKNVIYEARKDKKVFAFTVQVDGTYDVEVCTDVYTLKDYSFAARDILYDTSSFYLIDPDKGEEGIANVPAHTVLAASPNQKHFAEWSKGDNTLTWCMPVWTHDELKALQKEIPIGKDLYLKDIEFEARWNIFGGRIRFIYANEEHYQDHYNKLKGAISTLGFEKIIKVVGNGKLDINQEGKTESTGSSMIFIYDVFGYPFPNYKWRMIDGNYQTTLASPYLKKAIAVRYWHDLIDRLNPESLQYSNNATQNGRIFEFLASFLLGFEGEFYAFKQENLSTGKFDHKLDLIHGERRKSSAETWEKFLEECGRLPSYTSISTTLRTTSITKREVLIPRLTNQPVIDMMDAKDRAYQFCAGKSHAVNLNQLENIVETLNCSIQKPLRLYFIILESQKDSFAWKWSKTKGNAHVKDLVDIFVIFPLKQDDPKLIELLDEFRKI
jgi:hypothetical protein